MNADTDLSFLHELTLAARETAVWADGTMPLGMRLCHIPSAASKSRVSERCILRRGTHIMVIEDFKGEHHILPGGRYAQGCRTKRIAKS